MTEKNISQSSNTTKKILVVALIIVLAAFNVGQFVMHRKDKAEAEAMLQSKRIELIETYSKLDSISMELNLKLKEIERLGGNVDSLKVYIKQIENEKRELKAARNIASERYTAIKDKLTSYEVLLKNKDKEIDKLKRLNEELLGETIILKEQKDSLKGKISSMEMEKMELNRKITSASSLKAVNLTTIAVNAKGKERIDTEFKVNHLEVLKIQFNIDENKLAEIGTKKIILRITEPEGSALYSPSNSGTFTYQGNEIFYTSSQEILFDNSGQKVTFTYNHGSEYKKGIHKIELYCEGVMIGRGSFTVK